MASYTRAWRNFKRMQDFTVTVASLIYAAAAVHAYVWMSFQAGFGQTPASIITGVAVLMGAALFIYWQIASVAETGTYRANVFSAYAAGIGILAAQAVLVRALERQPEVRAVIEER
jgi:hypothetical protein